jgi:hypothetical protein
MEVEEEEEVEGAIIILELRLGLAEEAVEMMLLPPELGREEEEGPEEEVGVFVNELLLFISFRSDIPPPCFSA